MSHVASAIQGSAQAPAPPIPPLPSRPGGSTGGARVTVTEIAEPQAGGAAGQAQEAAREAATAAREAAEAARGAAEVARGGQGTTAEPPFIYDPNNVIPPEVVPLTAMSLAMLAVIFIGWPLARAFGRRMDRKAELGTVRAQDLQPQIRQLQESLDAMAVELERISEAQRFQAKLMSERERAPVLPSRES